LGEGPGIVTKRNSVMIALDSFEAIFIHRDPTDMRKSIDGLSVLVQEEMEKNPFSRALFLFCNRRRTHLKALYWEHSGFCVWFKRLEKEKFPWPKKDPKAVVTVTKTQLQWLLQGYKHWQMKPHQHLDYERVF